MEDAIDLAESNLKIIRLNTNKGKYFTDFSVQQLLQLVLILWMEIMDLVKCLECFESKGQVPNNDEKVLWVLMLDEMPCKKVIKFVLVSKLLLRLMMTCCNCTIQCVFYN